MKTKRKESHRGKQEVHIRKMVFIVDSHYLKQLMLSWEHLISQYQTITPRGSTGLASCEPLVTTFLSTSYN